MREPGGRAQADDALQLIEAYGEYARVVSEQEAALDVDDLETCLERGRDRERIQERIASLGPAAGTLAGAPHLARHARAILAEAHARSERIRERLAALRASVGGSLRDVGTQKRRAVHYMGGGAHAQSAGSIDLAL